MNLLIHIALPDNATAPLLQIPRSPGTVEIMQGNQPVLHIHTGAHFEGTAHQNTNLTSANLCKQFLFPGFRVCIMDECNLLWRNTTGNQLGTNVIIGSKGRIGGVECCKGIESGSIGAFFLWLLHAFLRRSLCFGCRDITKHQLCQLLSLAIAPNAENILNAHVDLRALFIRQIGVNDPLIQPQLSTIRGDLEHVVLPRLHNAAMNLRRAIRKLGYQLLLLRGGLCHFVVIYSLRARQVQLIRSFHICGFFPDVNQLRQVVELGKPGSCPVACALRSQLDHGFGFAKVGRPTVKMAPALFPEGIALQIPHHGIQLCHGVADGRSGCKDHAAPTGFLIQILALHIHIRRFLGICSGNTCHILHFCIQKEVFVPMCLVHEQPIHAKLLKGYDIILFRAGEEFFQPGFQSAFRSFHGFDSKSLGTAGTQLRNAFFHFRNLLFDRCLLPFKGHGNLFKLRVTNDHRIVVAGCDLRAEGLTVRRFKILSSCNKKVCGGIKPEKLTGPLLN